MEIEIGFSGPVESICSVGLVCCALVNLLHCHASEPELIYPGGLTKKEEGDEVAPEVAVTTNTPPTFIAMAADDPVRVETALFYTLALKNAKVPVELHVYPTGGHGYGLRPSKELVTNWPQRAADWIRSRGLLDRR